jgi:hypothetical protein
MGDVHVSSLQALCSSERARQNGYPRSEPKCWLKDLLDYLSFHGFVRQAKALLILRRNLPSTSSDLFTLLFGRLQRQTFVAVHLGPI